MQPKENNRNIQKKLVTSKSVFTISFIVIVLTVLSIWLLGLGQHRTIYENSLLSTTVLSIAFFLFLSIGLYNGIKLKDNVGNLTHKINSFQTPNIGDSTTGIDIIDVGDGIEGIIVSIVLWIVVSIVIALFIWMFGAIVWAGVIAFIAMLYWIFFRALRIVFRNSKKCKGKLKASVLYGISYTILYNCWIYCIILVLHFLVN